MIVSNLCKIRCAVNFDVIFCLKDVHSIEEGQEAKMFDIDLHVSINFEIRVLADSGFLCSKSKIIDLV
jgi:hypothetical protein